MIGFAAAAAGLGCTAGCSPDRVLTSGAGVAEAGVAPNMEARKPFFLGVSACGASPAVTYTGLFITGAAVGAVAAAPAAAIFWATASGRCAVSTGCCKDCGVCPAIVSAPAGMVSGKVGPGLAIGT